MIKKIFLIAAVMGIFWACSSGRSMYLPQSLKASFGFKQLWNDLAEVKFVPSEAVLEKHSLRKENGTYVVKGFLHPEASFDKEEFRRLGGKSTIETDTVFSYSIPVEKLPELVKMKGIKYIETGTKARLIQNNK